VGVVPFVTKYLCHNGLQLKSNVCGGTGSMSEEIRTAPLRSIFADLASLRYSFGGSPFDQRNYSSKYLEQSYQFAPVMAQQQQQGRRILRTLRGRAREVDAPPPPPAPVPAVGELPFDPRDVRKGDVKTTKRTSKRLPWILFNKIITRWLSPDWQQFLLSRPGFENDDDPQWVARWPLGEGTYGRVALWNKMGIDGDVVDEIVIKEWKKIRIGDIFGPHVVSEALYQGHLSAMRDAQNVVAELRSYKSYPNQEDTSKDQGRAYLNYAQYGTLYSIWARYRAWALHFPELFLWSIFYDFAQANEAMSTCPQTWYPYHPQREQDIPQVHQRGDDNFILHHDLKTDNTFVQTRSKGSKRAFRYPAAAIGDFGFSKVRDSVSPLLCSDEIWWKGRATPGWLPPEQTDYSETWTRDLYGHKHGTFRCCPKTNVIGIG
jgi:hypothetical protein